MGLNFDASVLLAIGVLALALMFAFTWTNRWFSTAGQNALGIFAGVVLALGFGSCVEQRSIERKLDRVVGVAIRQGATSARVLADTRGNFSWKQEGTTPKERERLEYLHRTILDPVPALDTLLRDIRFLEQAQPDVVASLLSENTRIRRLEYLWTSGGGTYQGGPRPLFLPEDLVLVKTQVNTVLDLLRDQRQAWGR